MATGGHSFMFNSDTRMVAFFEVVFGTIKVVPFLAAVDRVLVWGLLDGEPALRLLPACGFCPVIDFFALAMIFSDEKLNDL
jgi:hypothetical protein